MKIVSFGASSSKKSINQQFASYAAQQFENASIELLDINSFELPLFTIEREAEIGMPEAAKLFVSKLRQADLLIISLAEHNGSYTAVFKNLFDWASRVMLKMFENKKMILLSTATGPRGGLSVLEAAKSRFPIHGAIIIGSFSLPKFNENFSAESGIVHEELATAFAEFINTAKKAL
ncbi:MAG: hypothetical protein RI894_263 [Bacteroidota bacterium]|jgi:NAD(P)H-dependent FMN reductase